MMSPQVRKRHRVGLLVQRDRSWGRKSLADCCDASTQTDDLGVGSYWLGPFAKAALADLWSKRC